MHNSCHHLQSDWWKKLKIHKISVLPSCGLGKIKRDEHVTLCTTKDHYQFCLPHNGRTVSMILGCFWKEIFYAISNLKQRLGDYNQRSEQSMLYALGFSICVTLKARSQELNLWCLFPLKKKSSLKLQFCSNGKNPTTRS